MDTARIKISKNFGFVEQSPGRIYLKHGQQKKRPGQTCIQNQL